jgi:hypothetical protein
MSYTVEKRDGAWLISVAGVGFFRCGTRREALRTAKLAAELLTRAGRDGRSPSSNTSVARAVKPLGR